MFLCQKKPLQIPRSFPVAINSGACDDSWLPFFWTIFSKIFHGNIQSFTGKFDSEESGDDDDDDDDNDNDNVELQETQPSSIECEASTCPAEELHLLVWISEPCEIVFIVSEHWHASLAICSRKNKIAKKEYSSSSSQNLFLCPEGHPI
jgi:DNA-directed RNA polymerase III subunit RPC4